MDDEAPARPPQEGVIVVGGQHRLDRDHAVAARTVLDHDRLAPACLQAVLNKARADIGAGTRTERNDEPDRLLRPSLCLGPRWRRRHGENCNEGEESGAELRHILQASLQAGTIGADANRSIEEAQRWLAGERVRPAATMFRT